MPSEKGNRGYAIQKFDMSIVNMLLLNDNIEKCENEINGG